MRVVEGVGEVTKKVRRKQRFRLSQRSQEVGGKEEGGRRGIRWRVGRRERRKEREGTCYVGPGASDAAVHH